MTEKCMVTESSPALSPEIEAKLDTLLSIGEECITREELAVLLQKKPSFTAYDGFEPSGRMHIAQVRI
jgi:tyrosyl-tRNA synthetase